MADLSQYDITSRMAPFLDPHFMLPILRWLRERNIYPDVDVLAAEYDLARKTSNMITYVTETHTQLVEAMKAANRDASVIPAPELNSEALQAEFKTLMEAGAGVWSIIGDAAKVEEMRKDGTFNFAGLVDAGATEVEVNSMFDLARFYHRAGLYKQALEVIVLFRKLGPQDGSYRYFSTTWAQVAEWICMVLNPATPSTKKPLSSVAVGVSEPPDFALRVLRDTVEKRTTLKGVEEVEQRRWMLHWSLFVIFSRPKPHEELFDLFFSQREARSEQRTRKNDYLAIAQAVSPWLLRYVAYAAVLNHKNIGGKRQRQFVQVVQAEAEEGNYSGPLARIYVALFHDFDMEAALAAVRDSADAIRADFFLGHLAASKRGGQVDAVVNDFQQAALRIVFLEILKLHQEVNYDQAVAKYFGDFPNVTANTLRLWVAEYDRSTSSSSSSSKPIAIDESKKVIHCHQLFNVQITTIHQRIDQQTNELKNTANKLRNRFNEDRAFERNMGGGGGGGAGGGGGGKGGKGGKRIEHTPFNNPINSRDPRNKPAGGGGGSGGGKKKKHVQFEHTPFQNPINSRDPRNKPAAGATGADAGAGGAGAQLTAPVRQNTRWKEAPKPAATAGGGAGAAGDQPQPQAAPSPTNARWTEPAKAKEEPPAPAPAASNNADSGTWERAPKPAGSADSSSWR